MRRNMQIRLGWNYSWNSAKSPPQQKRVRRRLMVIGRAMMQRRFRRSPHRSLEREGPPRRSHPQRQNRHRRARRQRTAGAIGSAVLENSQILYRSRNLQKICRGRLGIGLGGSAQASEADETADKRMRWQPPMVVGGAMAAVVQPARLMFLLNKAGTSVVTLRGFSNQLTSSKSTIGAFVGLLAP